PQKAAKLKEIKQQIESGIFSWNESPSGEHLARVIRQSRQSFLFGLDTIIQENTEECKNNGECDETLSDQCCCSNFHQHSDVIGMPDPAIGAALHYVCAGHYKNFHCPKFAQTPDRPRF